MNTELPVFDAWQKIAGEILDRTARFPRTVRFTFASRIDNLCLDVLDTLIIARYAHKNKKIALLDEANLQLNRLLVFVRLAHERSYIGKAGYEHISTRIIDVGRMIGGWRKSV